MAFAAGVPSHDGDRRALDCDRWKGPAPHPALIPERRRRVRAGFWARSVAFRRHIGRCRFQRRLESSVWLDSKSSRLACARATGRSVPPECCCDSQPALFSPYALGIPRPPHCFSFSCQHFPFPSTPKHSSRNQLSPAGMCRLKWRLRSLLPILLPWAARPRDRGNCGRRTSR